MVIHRSFYVYRTKLVPRKLRNITSIYRTSLKVLNNTVNGSICRSRLVLSYTNKRCSKYKKSF